MYAWKHWRVTIDGTATEFELTDEDLAALTDYVGVPALEFQIAMRRWNDAGTAERPRGWSMDEDTSTIEAWVPGKENPGVLVGTTFFTDSLTVNGDTLVMYDLLNVTRPGVDGEMRVQLEPYFPELEKQAAAMPEARIISEFLDGQPEGIGLAKLDYERSMHYVVAEPLDSSSDIEKLLAAHFEIDLEQVEVERRALIGYLDHLNQTAKG